MTIDPKHTPIHDGLQKAAFKEWVRHPLQPWPAPRLLEHRRAEWVQAVQQGRVPATDLEWIHAARVSDPPRWLPLGVAGALIFIFLIAIGASAGSGGGEDDDRQTFAAPSTTSTPPRTTTTTTPPAASDAVVTEVVDGDTFKVADGRSVRVIGIDSPEVEPVECWGPEASAFAEQTLLNRNVRLISDPTQDALDSFGRTLAYVALPDGLDYSVLAADNGHAKAYIYARQPQKYTEIKAAENRARSANLGIWSDICNPPPPPPPPPSPAPEPEPPRPLVQPVPEPDAGGGLIVRPGSFCSPPGAVGVTSKGTPMVCGPGSDGRNRWHS